MKTLFKNITKNMRGLRALLLSAIVLFSYQAVAGDPVYTARFSNDAIKGYDTVAYHTQGAAVKGSDDYKVEWMGADWLFASAENKALFESDPEKYAPQYGGYCAYAVAQGDKAKIEPDQFTLVDGKLYLNYNSSIQEKWRANQDAYIVEADKLWPEVVNK